MGILSVLVDSTVAKSVDAVVYVDFCFVMTGLKAAVVVCPSVVAAFAST